MADQEMEKPASSLTESESIFDLQASTPQPPKQELNKADSVSEVDEVKLTLKKALKEVNRPERVSQETLGEK